jgi:hypothetical protein
MTGRRFIVEDRTPAHGNASSTVAAGQEVTERIWSAGVLSRIRISAEVVA